MVRFGGVRNPRSGARWDRRNDGRTSDELVEFKRTDNKRSITLKYTDLIELQRHAVVESRRPVLGFELGGDNFVVLPEREYYELAGRVGSASADPRTRSASLHGARQVLGRLRQQPGQSVLRRPPAQRAGAGGQGGVPGNPPGAPRPLPGPKRLPGVRPGQQREVRSLGRVLRKGATADQAGSASARP